MMCDTCSDRRERCLGVLLIGCVALWELLIWRFSAQPAVDSLKSSGTLTGIVARLLFGIPNGAQLLLVRYLVRKAAHMTEYAVLGMLLSAFCTVRPQPRALTGTLLCVLLTAAVDELHQSMVPGRACMLSDVAIDCAGAVLGVLLLFALLVRRERRMGLRRISA